MHTNSNDRAPRGGMSRRSFLATASTAAASAVAIPTCLTSVAFGKSAGSGRDVLITVFLRGGMDGLSAVVPAGDAAYTAARSGSNPDLLVTPTFWLDPQQFFGLNPAANNLQVPWNAGKLAIVHSAGLKVNGTRSHFDAMARIETGTDTSGPLSSGWVGRVLQQIPSATTDLRGASLTNLLPRMYAAAPQTLPIADPATFSFPATPQTEAYRKLHLGNAFSANADPILGPAGRTTLDAIDDVEAADTGSYGLNAGYPPTPFGDSMRSIASLMTAPSMNLEVAHVDFGGWDHHDSMGPMSGTFADMIADLSDSMKAFYEDLDGTGIQYTMIVQTEFGRRIVGNLSFGADHGKGGVMFVMGPNVSGGVAGPGVITNGWDAFQNPVDSPLLATNNDGGDLPVQIDWRDIVAEVLMDRLQLTQPDIDAVFPNLGAPTLWGVTT